MARENRRKREERRFGKPERLADLIVSTPAERWRWGLMPDELAKKQIVRIQSDIHSRPSICADNASDYYFNSPQIHWDYKTDFPCVSPPFPLFFLEMRCPRRINYGDHWGGPDPSAPRRNGFIFQYAEVSDSFFPTAASEAGLELDSIDDARWIGRGIPIWWENNDVPALIGARIYIAVDEK